MHRSACSRGYKLRRERESEAPRSLGVLGVIEVTANIGGASTCVLVVLRSVPPSPFYSLKEVGLHAWGSVRSFTSPPVVWGRTDGLPCRRALVIAMGRNQDELKAKDEEGL